MHVFYLHGFASSARSGKAAFFAGRFAGHGITLHTPDFNEPEFSTLTVTRMVGQVERCIESLPRAPIALIGSSLGGFVAVQCALRLPHTINRLVLLAPALDFSGDRLLGDRALDDWRRADALEVFHYGFGRVMPVRYGLYTDAVRYDCTRAQLASPVQIFQGRRDTAVEPESVERWASARPSVELHMLDDDHQLLGSLDYIWSEMTRFLDLSPDVPATGG